MMRPLRRSVPMPGRIMMPRGATLRLPFAVALSLAVVPAALAQEGATDIGEAC
jgi:hypothetical protein